MKIRISDTNNGKFSHQLEDHWKSLDHDVERSMYYETRFADEADVYFFDSADMTLEHFCKDKRKRPNKVIARSFDIDLWHRYFNNWDFDWIDHWVFINEYMKDWALPQLDKPVLENKITVIPCGVDTNHFSLRKNDKGKKIAWIGRFWIVKMLADAIKITREVNKRDPGWSLHILGNSYDPPYWGKYCDHLMQQQDFPVHIDDRVDDVNEWLEDKDYILTTSTKECFSYVTAEGMSKGLKPVINNFWDAKSLWPEEYVYTTHSEAADIILSEYKPEKYRQYILDNYDQKLMFKRIDSLIK